MIKPGEIHIKDSKVLRALMERNYAPLLIRIVNEIADEFGVYITEAWRKSLHAGDVHSTNPGRGVDLRSWVYSERIKKEIERKINKRWEYDSNRPEKMVVQIHKVKNGVFHFHLQTHHRTRLRQL